MIYQGDFGLRTTASLATYQTLGPMLLCSKGEDSVMSIGTASNHSTKTFFFAQLSIVRQPANG
jgi:hypothetical protein